MKHKKRLAKSEGIAHAAPDSFEYLFDLNAIGDRVEELNTSIKESSEKHISLQYMDSEFEQLDTSISNLIVAAALTDQNTEEDTLTLDKLEFSLSLATKQAISLQRRLETLLTKHEELKEEHKLSQLTNSKLLKELSELKLREASLMGHLRIATENYYNQEGEIKALN